MADEVVEKLTLMAAIPLSDTFKWIADGAYVITHVTFHNYAGAAFTVAGHVDNAAAVVVNSTATLAADTVEEFEAGALANTAVADGAELNLVAGDQTTFIVVTMTKKVNV